MVSVRAQDSATCLALAGVSQTELARGSPVQKGFLACLICRVQQVLLVFIRTQDLQAVQQDRRRDALGSVRGAKRFIDPDL